MNSIPKPHAVKPLSTSQTLNPNSQRKIPHILIAKPLTQIPKLKPSFIRVLPGDGLLLSLQNGVY